MKRFQWISANLVGLIFCSLVSVNAARAGGSVALDVQLNPIGSFTGKSDAVRGSAKKSGDTYVANKLLLDLDTLSTGMELRDKHMKEHYFETGKSKVNKWAMIAKAKGSGGKFEAILMIRGVKKPISGTYSVSGSTFKAKFTTHLSDFKIKKAEYMGVGVVDEVGVTAEIPIGSGT